MSQINQCCVDVLLPTNLQDCNELIHLFILTAVALFIYHHHRVISPSFSFSSSTSAISSSFSSAFSCSSLKPDRFCQSPTYCKEFHILNHKVSLGFFFDTTSPPIALCLPQKIKFWWWSSMIIIMMLTSGKILDAPWKFPSPLKDESCKRYLQNSGQTTHFPTPERSLSINYNASRPDKIGVV